MSDILSLFVYALTMGVMVGMGLGFICWAIGFGIYGIIKMFKMA
jgi:hypothetical protein